MDLTLLLSTEAKELYDNALTFLKNGDINNYCIYMTMSANLDYVPAKEHLHFDYHNDRIHLQQDHMKTRPFYEQTKNFGYSANYLGYMYANGNLALNKDTDKEVELYGLAIEKGNIIAMYNIGLHFNRCKNDEESIKYFQMAADNGNCRAANALGKIYFEGKIVSQDYNKALTLWEKAMKDDQKTALNNLILLYEKINLKDDFEYVINYFTNIKHIEAIQNIYKLDYNIFEVLKENIQLKRRIDTMQQELSKN